MTEQTTPATPDDQPQDPPEDQDWLELENVRGTEPDARGE
jgi:hypothetical protein